MPIIIASGRNSLLSKAQIEHFATHLQEKHQIQTQIHHVKTYGDMHLHSPIHALPITNPFVKEVHNSLENGTSQIGISSLKDVEITGNLEIETVYFSSRTNPRDALFLSKQGIEKIKQGKTIVVGTSSLRRQFSFEKIAKEILPNNTAVEFKSIRGNITSRIAMLHNNVDAIIIAIAGILRLNSNPKYCNEIQHLLRNVRSITLPISHFATPPGQGVIIGQCLKTNANNACILKAKDISCEESKRVSIMEKETFASYGKGCRESYGVTHLVYKNHECTFVNGKKSTEEEINVYKNFKTPPKFERLFDTRAYKNIFKVKLLKCEIPLNANKFIVSNFKSVNNCEIIQRLQSAKEVWASGFETMKKLASVGVLCSGCLESMGTDAMPSIHFTTNLEYNPSQYYILTHSKAREFSTQFNIIPTYELTCEENSEELQNAKVELQKCDAVFWSSVEIYKLLKYYCKSEIHITLLGNTFNHLKSNGILPYGFFNHEQLNFYIESNETPRKPNTK